MLINILASFKEYVPIIVILVLLVAFFVWSYISQKKKQKSFTETVNAIKPGSKVKTIGGICGVVVEINDDENTFVLETGTSDGQKSYIKFDKQAIYQTDAKPTPVAEPKKEEPAPIEEVAGEKVEEDKE